MIRFSLACDHEHAFEGWFRNNADFDGQKERGLLSCPVCGSETIEKALMAPAVGTATRERQASEGGESMALPVNEAQREAMIQLRELAAKVKKNSDYVGDKFAEEARKIHFGETKPRGIYGEATREEAKSLAEDGVGFLPLPVFPEDRN